MTGGGWIWYNKNQSQREILCDIDPEVANAWKHLCNAELRKQLLWRLSWSPHGRSLFEELAAQEIDPLTVAPIDRALRFLVLQSTSFGGKGGHAGFAAHKSGRHHIAALIDRISTMSGRLDGVEVWHRPYDATLAMVDRPGVMYYADPPYIDTEGYYKAQGFRHDWLAWHLRNHVAGKWLLSYEDHPLLDQLYPPSQYPRVTRSITRQIDNSTGNDRKTAQEILIRNY